MLCRGIEHGVEELLGHPASPAPSMTAATAETETEPQPAP